MARCCFPCPTPLLLLAGRYEGEFRNNQMEGMGVYVWGQEDAVYRGEWHKSMLECGVKITKMPDNSYLAEEGRFFKDEWVSGCGWGGWNDSSWA